MRVCMRGMGEWKGLCVCVCVCVCVRAWGCACDSSLIPSLPWCHLKTTNKGAKYETLQPFSFLFHSGM